MTTIVLVTYSCISLFFFRKYFSIADDAQRQKYKHDFNTQYAEYRELHTVIEKVSKKFYELQVLRKKTPKDTIAYEVKFSDN